MKKYFLLSLLAFFALGALKAQRIRPQTVKTAEELLQEIGSNKILKIKTEKLNLSSLRFMSSNANVSINNTPEGLVIEIRDTDNLTIEGDMPQAVKTTSDIRQKPILSFINCKNLSISNLEFGYSPGNRKADGDLLYFQNVENLTLRNIVFQGEAGRALSLEGVRKASLSNLKISGCSKGILSMRNCSELTFQAGHFFNNRRFDLINVFDSEQIVFDQCRIDYNYTGTGAEYDNYALINAPLSPSARNPVVTLKKCVIEENYLQYFCRSSAAVVREDCRLDNNLFVKGYSSLP